MAALGTIRKRGVILVCIISFGLFAFIAEEAFRSCDSAKNNERQQIGEVFGEKISVQEFQKLVDEYTEVIKMQQGQDNLPEEQMNQVKDMVWNSYIQNKIVAHEAEKLGLTVTDAELQDILKTGTSPMLAQTPFVNQQTGRFDVSALQKFLADYKAQKANPSANAQMLDQYTKIYNYWSFIEKTLRQQTLAQKYQSLLAHCFLSNPVEAKMAFKEENEESKIQLAAFPYSDIQDDKVKVVESDLKAKYDEMKARFKQPVESRDIKFVDIQVQASQADRAALNKEFAGFQTQLAAFPYSDIQDDKVKVVESDLKAKYDEMKARFKQPVESRDIKFVDIQVQASQADRAALNKEFAGFQTQLAAAADPTEVVRKSASTVAYLGIPVGKDAFPSDIAATLDSMAVGATTAVKANTADNTLNIVKLVNKQQLPDSIQYRVIQVAAASVAEAKTKADSIQGAISGGADFEAIAKKYGQTGEKAWMTTRQYEFAQSMDKDNKAFINALNTQAVNATSQLQLGQGYVILQVCDRKAMIEKYTAAVIKKNVDFSQDTYRTAYNKFSSFVSANQTADEIVKNAAKSGYKVQDLKDITTATHYVANIHSTREALKWIFEAKEGSVSPMYECGNNDHLLVVVLDKINRIGFRGLDDPQVKEMVKAEVIKDKKAEMIEAKLSGVKNIAAAKSKGAKVSEVNQITFAAPVFVASAGASEPALSGAVSATKKGAFSAHPVKGNAGVYLFLVTNKSNRPVKFDEKAQEQKCRQKSMQYAGNFMNELYLNANVVDNRYLFF